jgi:Tol biopolymer transport system component
VFEEGRENYIADIARGTLIRITFDPGEDETPIWSPDGKSVLYTSTRTNLERAIFRRHADGSGSEEQIWSGPGHLHLGNFTPDGRTLVIAIAREQQFDIATFTIGDKDLKPLLTSRFNKTSPVLSPDGKWLAYVSDETGRDEVYVQPFPSLNGRWPISNNGGTEPIWSRNGRRLFYRTVGKLMAVDVTGEPFAASAPVAQFEDRFLATQGDSHTCYDAFADGRQFLMVARAGGSTLPTHVNLILNGLAGR